MKRISVLFAVVVLLVGCVSALNAAATIYGLSGLIETPDDSIASAKTLTPVVNRVFKISDTDTDITTFGGAIGILPNLEVSAVAVDANDNSATQGVINGKYRVLAETATAPSLTVGVMDIAKRLDTQMSAFVLVSKNISSVAEGVSGQVSKPIKGSLGLGTGFYNGFFGGLDMAIAPKLSLAVEYLGKGLRNDSTVSGCVRFQPTSALSIDAGALGFKDFYAGASYNVSTF